MDKEKILTIVVDVVAQVAEFPVEDLVNRFEDHLVTDLGVDSVKLIEIWVEIEYRLGLEIGAVGMSQAATIRSITEHILKGAE